MKTILLNMCMIHDLDRNQVVVLDKKIVHGWEGLTFPGGHVETCESLVDSVRREVIEETGLEIGKVEFRGFVHWINFDDQAKQVGLLFYTNDYRGELIEHCDEGELYWMDLNEFLDMEDKSGSMDDCMKVYLEDGISEAVTEVRDGRLDFEYR